MKRKIEQIATDKRGMTLAELEAFVLAHRGAASSTVVRAQVTMGGKLKSIAIEIDSAGAE